jgi:RNA polymerase sigma-70 factor, ECF subfamily
VGQFEGCTPPSTNQSVDVSDCSVPWNQIIAEHGPMLYRAAYCILHDDGEAEDVVQDVLLEAYRTHAKQATVPAAGLLRRMVTCRAIDRLRRRRRAQPIDNVPVVQFRDIPDRVIQEMEQADHLRQALSRLPSRQAECFLLRYMEGMSCEEIAESLGVSSSSVTTALYKARTRLRALMSAYTRPECP